MTTNNHPAHGPVSLERLHQIREILSKASAQSDGGNLSYAMADAVKVIDGAIAAFGAEPVEFLPDNLDMALNILGVALPISQEEFNFEAEAVRVVRALVTIKGGFIRYEKYYVSDLPDGDYELYTAPPAPVVPDEIDVNDPALDTHRKWMAEGWNRCRAAMINGDKS